MNDDDDDAILKLRSLQ